MKTSIVRIGNSRGIRIPKTLLEECHIEDQVELQKRGASLVISAISNTPRRGWSQAFSLMHKNKEDALMLDEGVEEMEAFEWK